MFPLYLEFGIGTARVAFADVVTVAVCERRNDKNGGDRRRVVYAVVSSFKLEFEAVEAVLAMRRSRWYSRIADVVVAFVARVFQKLSSNLTGTCTHPVRVPPWVGYVSCTCPQGS